jgi:hypothetical protein
MFSNSSRFERTGIHEFMVSQSGVMRGGLQRVFGCDDRKVSEEEPAACGTSCDTAASGTTECLSISETFKLTMGNQKIKAIFNGGPSR